MEFLRLKAKPTDIPTMTPKKIAAAIGTKSILARDNTDDVLNVLLHLKKSIIINSTK